MANQIPTNEMDSTMNTTIMDMYIKFGGTWVTTTNRNVIYMI